MLLRLRWRLFVNSLRRPNRRAELGLQIILFFFGGMFVLGTSTGFLAGTIGLLHIRRADFLDLLLWAVFLVWQLAPILFEGYSPGLNFQEVARYPVPFRLYFLLSNAYGVTDPAAATAMLWLLSIWLGIAIERPEWILPATFAFLLFAIFNLLLNRWVMGLFDRFQSTRKGRERMVFVMLMFIVLMNIAQLNLSSWTAKRSFSFPAWQVEAVKTVRHFSPPGLTLQFVTEKGLPAAGALGGLLLCGGLVFLLLQRQLRGIYQGEIYAEAYTVRKERKIRLGWRVPLVDEVTAAMIEKEIRYIRQTSRMVLQLVYPPILFLLIAFNGPAWKKVFAGRPQAILAGLAAFALMSIPNLAYNIFGLDNEGFGRWLLSPPPLRKVLMAKNITHGGLLVLVYLVMAAGVVAMFHVPVLTVLTVTVAFAAILVLQLCVGNVVSVQWPKRIELSRMNSRMSSSTAGITLMLVMVPLSAIIAAVVFASRYWQLPWLPLLCGAVALAASFKIYSYVLDWAARYTWEHIEEITGNLGA